ncbi:hypothetical protein D3C77_344150 [compost metagenome]
MLVAFAFNHIDHFLRRILRRRSLHQDLFHLDLGKRIVDPVTAQNDRIVRLQGYRFPNLHALESAVPQIIDKLIALRIFLRFFPADFTGQIFRFQNSLQRVLRIDWNKFTVSEQNNQAVSYRTPMQ